MARTLLFSRLSRALLPPHRLSARAPRPRLLSAAAKPPWRVLTSHDFYSVLDALAPPERAAGRDDRDSAEDVGGSGTPDASDTTGPAASVEPLPVVLVTSQTCSVCRALKSRLASVHPHLRPSFTARGAGPFRIELFELDAGDDPGVAADLGCEALPAAYLWRGGEPWELEDLGVGRKGGEEGARGMEATVGGFAAWLGRDGGEGADRGPD
ncbi:hypothetical protein DFJ74DRAFT_737125 [Hyaloraphidium curvatum]|nr:hypothetical protein DFJ74DRAFT_737125 [Hyaloraphidium curvatum]